MEDLFLFCKNPKSSRPFSFVVTMLWLNLKRKKKLDLDLVEIVHGKKEMYLFSKEKNNVVFFPRQIENDNF